MPELCNAINGDETMENKLMPLATRIDAETLLQFRIAVLKKHSRLYGYLKDEITRALKKHIHTMECELKEGGAA